MFQKTDSASLSGKKKQALDTPVRKSDRRKARNAASAFFARYNSSCNNEGTGVVEAILDNVFLQGTLVIRKLTHHAQFQATVHLYLRGPSSLAERTDAINGGNDTEVIVPLSNWPYTKTTECVWMTVDVGPNTPPRDCPSVALLSVLLHEQNALPPVIIPSHASKFICRGAHVMRAGMLSIPEGAIEGSIVAIQAYGNPQPFAVGMLRSTTQADLTSGIGVDVWMCYGDDLYRTTTAAVSSVKDNGSAPIMNQVGGAPFDNGHYGNLGFLEGKFVRPIVSMDDSESEGDEEVDEEKYPSEEMRMTEALSKVEIGTQASGADPSAGDEVTPVLPSPDEESETDEEPSISADDLLHISACQAMVNLKDKELPMAASIFYANHVLPNRPPGTTIQLKQTSFKKFGTYLLHQQDCSLLTLAQDMKDNNPAGFLQTINRRHEDFRGFKKTASAAGGDAQIKLKMSIVMLKVVPNHFVNLMRLDVDDVKAANAKSVDRRGTGMLTVPEVRAILEKYCKANELIALDATEVTLDGPLTDALYKKSKAPAPTSLSRKELNDAWVGKMESAFAVVQMPGSKITKLARGVPPKVQIEVSKRSGRNKFSTRIRGVEEYGIDGDVFCKDVMRRFACSGTIETDEPTMGNLKKGHVEISFQGHLIEELRALLLGDERLTTHGGAKDSDYSIPKQSIAVTLKKGVAAKKSKR